MELRDLVKESYFHNKKGMLLMGDTIEWMSKLPDKSVDMILADLPYGTTKNKWDSLISLEMLWKEYKRIIKESGAICLTAQTPFDKVLGASNLEMLRYEWIWEKPFGTGFMNANKMPLKSHENVLVFYKKSPRYNPQMEQGKPYVAKRGKTGENYGKVGLKVVEAETINNGSRYPKTTSLKFSYDKEKIHPTQKPISLFEYLIKTYTNENEIVLDNVSGSGTTAVAATKNNRRWICIEKEKKYCDGTIERLKSICS